LTVTIATVNPSIHPTDKYLVTSLSGTTLGPYTMVVTASGNYRIPLPLIAPEKQVVANVTFSSAAQSGVAVINMSEA
jgi:hypothetical protein